MKFEPLKWVKASEYVDEEEPVVNPPAAIATEAKAEADDGTITEEWDTESGEHVKVISARSRAKNGTRSNRCATCGCETDTSKNCYCKSCWAEYQRERYHRNKE